MASNQTNEEGCLDDYPEEAPCRRVSSTSRPTRRRTDDATCPDASKVCRYERRQVRSHTDYICPLCQLTINHKDLASHLDLEIRKLSQIGLPSKRSQRRKVKSSSSSRFVNGLSSHSSGPSVSYGTSSSVNGASGSSTFPEDSTMPSTSANDFGGSGSTHVDSISLGKPKNIVDVEGFTTYETYRRIKINRLLRIQNKKWQYKDLENEATCPVCGEIVMASEPEELQVHVEKCLDKQDGGEDSEDEEIDVEGDSYEWCGLRKVRLTSLLRSQGQLEALGTRLQKGNEEENVEVCMLENEENQYGPSQYTQEDISPTKYRNELDEAWSGDNNLDHSSTRTTDDDFINDYPRDTNLTEENCGLTNESSVGRSANGNESEVDVRNNGASVVGENSGCSSRRNVEPNYSGTVLRALREKIEDLESKGSFICHICHGQYITPLTSISCWHVHCEKCWLQALSNQKLCPQCKTIVSPTDLRRVYL